jgi:hypothetical protein
MADHSDQRRPDCRPRDALARAQHQRHERRSSRRSCCPDCERQRRWRGLGCQYLVHDERIG